MGIFRIWIDAKTLELAKIKFETGLCITTQIAGPARKLDAYIAVARHLGVKKVISDLESFAKDTTSLSERRNRIVHDPWIVEKNHIPSRLEATARKTLRFLLVPVDTAEICKLCSSIKDHTERFAIIHRAIFSELNT